MKKTLCILGVDYLLTDKKSVINNGDTVAGKCCTTNKYIQVEKLKKDEYEFMHTILHETGHAMWFESSLFQTDIGPNVEEIIVNTFATVLLKNFDIKLKNPSE